MKQKTLYVCSDCGNESPKWSGKCFACGAWNTLQEMSVPTKKTQKEGNMSRERRGVLTKITQIDVQDEIRFDTGMEELNRVLGGGAVHGSLVLVGGEPGIGKSTILLQICSKLCSKSKVLYISGEESSRQLKLRAERLGVNPESLYVYAGTDVDDILAVTEEVNPDIMIVDSIQTVYRSEITSTPGSVSQVKECTMTFMEIAKGKNITVFVVGHVNKDGYIAGPKVLEHMVDCVLYFEGDKNMSYRILRAAKNRYGSTNEIGVFEMRDKGLAEVKNPSAALLEGRPCDVPGTCVACTMEGSRPILAEIQALVATTAYGTARRMSSGIDYNRAALLLAVLEKRAGFKMGNLDAYVNVIGGLKIEETSADLPTVLAIASACRDKPLPADLAAFGEIGLTGEIRAVSAAQQRINEIKRLGFRRCVVPRQNQKDIVVPDGLDVMFAKNIREAISALV
ncbi:MAG: DNA repair protein RadA [Ruminococcaceae bacterium]|nr:DNA repair protein RadA [Oscillospiraceae bacterium]